MIETVRSALLERGFERGCRFIVTANLLDDMRVYLLFNRLRRHSQRVLDCQRRARAMRDDADAVYAEKRAAAIFFIVRLVLNCSNSTLSEERAGLSHCCAHEFVLEPLKHCHGDRFARFQDDIANESVAHHNLHRVLNKCRPSMLPTKFSELGFSILNTSLVNSVPLTSSSPSETKPTVGFL